MIHSAFAVNKLNKLHCERSNLQVYILIQLELLTQTHTQKLEINAK